MSDFDIGTLGGKIELEEKFDAVLAAFSKALEAANKDMSAFQQNVGKAGQEVAQQSQSMGQSIISGIGIAIGEKLVAYAEAGVHAVLGMLDGLLALGDQMTNTSAAFGVGVEALQAFNVAGAAVGVSGEAIAAGLRKLQTGLASGSAEVGNAVKFLGLSAQQLKDMKPEEQLQTILERVDKIPNAMDRTAVATTLLGRAGAMLAPLGAGLQDAMQKAKDLGIVMSADTIKAADDLGDEVGLLGMTFGGLKNNFVSVIVESEPLHVFIQGLTDILGELSVWVKQNEKDLRSFVDGGVVFAANALVGIVGVIQAAAAGFKGLADIFTVVTTASKLLIDTQNILLLIMSDPAGAVLHAKDIFSAYAATTKATLTDAQTQLKSHQDALDKLVSVSDNVKNKFEVLAQKVAASAGAHHDAADKVDHHTKSLYQSAAAQAAAAAAAKKAAEEVKKEQEAYDAFFLLATKTLKEYELPVADAITREATARALLSSSLRVNAKDFGVLAEEINKQRRAASEAMGGSGQLVSEIKLAGEETMKFWSRDPKIAADLAASGGKLFGTALTKGIGDQLKENLPQAILGAIQGGGNVFQAIGSSLGSTIFGKDSGFTKGATKFLTDNLGDTFGKAFGSLIPGIGALAGPLLGKLGGLIGNLFGGEEKKVNKLRQQFIDAAGGLDALNVKAHNAGMTLDQLLSAKKVTDFQAAMDKLNLGFDDQAQTQEFLNATIEKYGFTVDQLGPAFQKQELTKQAQELINEYEALSASGISHVNIIEKMGPAYSKFAETAIASNTEIPRAMQPMMEELARAGKLVHENGEAFTQAEIDGLKFGDTLEVSIGKIADSVERLVNALLGINNVKINPVDIPLNPRWLDGDGQGGRFNLPEHAAGGIATSPTVGIFGESGPEALIPLDQLDNMLRSGGSGDGPEQPINVIVGDEPVARIVMKKMRDRWVRV